MQQREKRVQNWASTRSMLAQSVVQEQLLLLKGCGEEFASHVLVPVLSVVLK